MSGPGPTDALPTLASLDEGEIGKKEFLKVDPLTGAVVAGGDSYSLFSPWYVFKYTGGVSEIKDSTYVQARAQVNTAARKKYLNPTAASIIDWGQNLPTLATDYTLWSAPYSWSDFVFCKYYGVISNNRMITLRKYPVAIDDTARPQRKKENKSRFIPIAQAITWFGDGTSNDINNFWQNSWSMPWIKKSVDQKDVEGNEITNFSAALKKIFTDNGADKINPLFSSVLDIALTAADMDAKPNQSGYQAELATQYEKIATSTGKATIEQKRQEFLRSLYSDNGAYFNQILGPVNVKNKFLMRDRGLSGDDFDTEMSLTFEFRTDSYFGLDQRRVALDILANMLELTYSDGDWLEVLNIYYKKTGLALTKTEQEMVSNSMKGSKFNPDELFNALAKITKARISAALDFTLKAGGEALNVGGNFLGNLVGLNDPLNADPTTLKTALNIAVVRALGETFPNFVQRRSAVGNQATGNWHMTIGNPMNPIMQMGDLVCVGATCTFNDELGPNDFPTEMKFVVKLKRTKPRDSADIRRAFDLGRTDYIDSKTGNTADQFNTYSAVGTELNSAAAGTPTPSGTNSNLNFVRAEAWVKSRYGSDIWNTDTQSLINDVYFYMPKAAKQYPTGGGTEIQTNNS